VLDDDRALERIANDHHPFIGIVRIDRSWRVWNLQSLLEARSAAWANLRLDSNGKPRLEPERDERGHAALERERRVVASLRGGNLPHPTAVGALDRPPEQICAKIIAGRSRCGALRRLRVGIEKLDDQRCVDVGENRGCFSHDDVESRVEDGRKMHASRATR